MLTSISSSISQPPSTIPFHVGASACSRPVTRVKCTSGCGNREVIGIFFFVPQQGWRWTGWTCTARNTNLSKASSTWRRLASSRCGHKDRRSVTYRTKPQRDWGGDLMGKGGGGGGSWYSPCVNTFQDMCTAPGSVAVKNGPLHIETSVYLCVISIQAELPVHPISSGGSC